MISFKEFVLKEDLNKDAQKIVDYIRDKSKEDKNFNFDFKDPNNIIDILDNDEYISNKGEVTKEFSDKVEELLKEPEEQPKLDLGIQETKDKVESKEDENKETFTFKNMKEENASRSTISQEMIKKFLEELKNEQTKNLINYDKFIQTGKFKMLFDENKKLTSKSIGNFLSDCKNKKQFYPTYELAILYLKQLLLVNLFNYGSNILVSNASDDLQINKSLTKTYPFFIFTKIKKIKHSPFDEDMQKLLNSPFDFNKTKSSIEKLLNNIKIVKPEEQLKKDQPVTKQQEKINNTKEKTEKTEKTDNKIKNVEGDNSTENIYNIPKINIPLYFNSKEDFEKNKEDYFKFIDEISNKVNEEIKKHWDAAAKERSDYLEQKSKPAKEAEEKSKTSAGSSWGTDNKEKNIKEELLESIPIIGRMSNKLKHSYEAGQSDKENLDNSFKKYITKFKKDIENLYSKLDPDNKYNYSSYEKVNSNRKLKENLYTFVNKMRDFSYKSKKLSKGSGLLKGVSDTAEAVSGLGKAITSKIKTSDTYINRKAHDIEDVNNITNSISKFLSSNTTNEKESMLRDRLSNCLYGGFDSQHGVRNFEELNNKICYFFELSNFKESGSLFYKNLVKELGNIPSLSFLSNNYYNDSISEAITKIISDRSGQTSKWKTNAINFTTIMQKAKIFAKVINDEIISNPNGLKALGENGIADPQDEIIINLSNKIIGIDKKLISKVISQGCAWYNNSYLKVTSKQNTQQEKQPKASVVTSAAVGNVVP